MLNVKNERGAEIMTLKKRIAIISEIVQKKPGVGKTAIMKFVFLLQKVYKVPLGYNFEIYTYGPYSSEVMEDIDFANQQEIITIHREIYPNGVSGYRIEPSRKLECTIKQEKDFINENEPMINNVIKAFGNRNAKELELLTTIVYLYGTYKANNWPLDEVPSNVHEIKPHFDIETIEDEYHNLDTMGILHLSVV